MDDAPEHLASFSLGPQRTLSGGRGVSRLLVDPETAGSSHVDVHLNELNPDGAPGPLHYHERSENIYVVLEGSIEVTVEDRHHLLEPEDVLFIPPGLPHRTTNAGATTARFVEIYAPPGPDFHELDTKGRD